jgi:putative OPT family oligopeptide transporter
MSDSFRPFVPADSKEPEFTTKAVVAGIVMAAVFGAANAYLGMKAGQTVAATIPAAVVAIWLFRFPFFRGGVLEQNLTRTAASVGEALVAGAIFTLPAFILVDLDGRKLWSDFRGHYWEGALILLAGGLLGVFFIIILRRPLCVDSDLPFPESTASAEIVKAGQATGTDAPRYIFGALGVGALLQLLKDEKAIPLFKETISGLIRFPKSVIHHFDFAKKPIGDVEHLGAISFSTPSISPALIGIGYIIGPRLSAINFSGGVVAWWILIPLVLFVDPDLPNRFPAALGARAPYDLLAYTVWYNIVRPIAVGAMLVGAVYTLYSMRESLLRSLKGAWASTRPAASGQVESVAHNRLDMDIPIQWIVISIVVLVIPISFIYYHFTHQIVGTILAALVMTLTGFVLAAIGGYLVGLVGSSNQPVSGLTLSALVVAALVMVAIGVRGLSGMAAVLGVASVVCCACCVSGSLIQDLKAGYLLGGTPWKMQVAEILSVAALSFFLVFPMMWLHQANLATGGIGGRELPAPQAGLMATLAKGIVGGQMAWGLILMGCLFGVVLVMIDAPSPMLIAVGMYLPLETTSAIFVGGALRWVADRIAAGRSEPDRAIIEQRGTLVASGFIAGEAIAGIVLAGVFLLSQSSIIRLVAGVDHPRFYDAWGGYLSLVALAVIAYGLIRIPLRKAR